MAASGQGRKVSLGASLVCTTSASIAAVKISQSGQIQTFSGVMLFVWNEAEYVTAEAVLLRKVKKSTRCCPGRTTTRMLLEESSIDYADGDITCRGVLVHQLLSGSQPGVILFPDARGLGDTAKRCARRIAECGYVVLIADLYGQGTFTADIPQAHELMTLLRSDVERWRQRGRAALKALAGQPAVDATRLAAIGYCFGGTTALELGRSGAELAAIVSFHGGLASPRPQDAACIKARVLACHGGADPVVPPAQVTEFVSHMTRAAVDWTLEVYAGALHAFTQTELAGAGDPDNAYDARADERSWRAMTELLGDVFGR
jgi:dienelactone hydrolase